MAIVNWRGQPQTIYSDALAEVRLSCGSLLVGGKSYTTYTVNFDVADETGDAASDFIYSGYHQDFSSYNWGANVVKKGVGTWELRRTFGQTGYVKVNAGTLLYGDVSRKGLTLGAGARVNVTLADADATVRVGTSKCLTAEQLSAFRVNGHRALQDEAGYLVPSGSLILVR